MVNALAGQGLMDVCIEHSGTLENCFALALANGLSITDDLSAGDELQFVPELTNNAVLDTYRRKFIHPANATLNEPAVIIEEGIGYWAIEDDFIIT